MASLNNHARSVLAVRSEFRAPGTRFSGTAPKSRRINPNFSLDRSGYQVCLAGDSGQLRDEVNQLVASMYRARGLGADTSPATARQPDQVTIAASRGLDVVGTLTLRMDSDAGLLAESLYQSEINSLRASGSQLCEVTRLALNAESDSPEVMATIFHVAFVLASEVHSCSDLVAEVHPRHVGFYRRTMGYRVVGPERTCLRVGAPAVLMHLSLDFARSQISELAGTCIRQDRNLYRLFLPVEQQSDLLEKLTTPANIAHPGEG